MVKNNCNPFVNNSEKRLFLVGIFAFLIAALLTYYNNILMLGTLKIVYVKPKDWYISLYNLGLTIIANVLVLYVFALLRFFKTRFIDVLNTVLIAHLAMYLLLAVSCIPLVADFLKSIEFLVLDHIENPTQIPVDKLILMVLFGFFSIGCLVAFFILLVMGMKIAINSKKSGDTIVIVICTLVLNTVLQFINIYV